MRAPRVWSAGLLMLATAGAGAADPASVSWPLPPGPPWSNVVLAPSDPVKNEFTAALEPLGEVLLGGTEGDPVVAVEAGTVTFRAYAYRPSWRTIISNDDLAELTRDVQALPGSDPGALHVTLGIANTLGATVYYAGLAVGQPLPKTGTKVTSGQILGRLGHAYPHQPPNLSLQGSNRAGTNRLLSVLKSPYPPLPVENPRSRADQVSRAALLKDLEVFWGALAAFYPGLYDQTPRKELDQALVQLRDSVPAGGLSVGEFANRLRRFLGLFSDNHMAVWETANPADAVFLPLEFGAVGPDLYVLSSSVKLLPPGAAIASVDGIPAATLVKTLWTQGGRSDGTLGTWERETLARNAGSLWVRTSGHRASDKVRFVLKNGTSALVSVSRSPVPGQTDWWTRTESLAKARGTRLPGWEDTPSLILRRVSAGIDALTLNSFDWSEVEKAALDRYFAEGSPAVTLILDLRNNPGGEESTERDFLGYFIEKPLEPFVFKAVLQRRLPAVAGVGNLIGGDERTFGRFEPASDGTFQAPPGADERIAVRQEGRFRGRLIVLTNGMTGSAAFDTARLLQASGRAVLVGRPGPHGTNRMVAEKFAQVFLPATGLQCRVPLVKIVTEPGGDSGPAKPLKIDYPVEILLDTLLLNRDPEWDTAVELARQAGNP